MNLYVILEKIRRLLKIRTRRHALTFLISFLLSIYFFTLVTRLRYSEFYSNLKDSVKYHLSYPDDVSCYNRKNKEIAESTLIKENAIYLISASCDSSLSVHHACVIESVIATHGYYAIVYVLFIRPVTECAGSDALIKGLKGLPSLNFITIQIDKFVEDTPLKGIFGGNFLKIGRKKHARVAEYLKFATLYKFGGTVIDLDTIMAKPVTYLGLNWAVRINGSQLGSAAISLAKKTAIGKSLLNKTVQILKEQRDQEVIDGGLALTEAFRQLCYDNPVVGCSKFKIYGSELFYPYNKSASYMMFEKGQLQVSSFGYYVWDRTEIRRNRGSVYVQVMREHCPNLESYYNNIHSITGI